MKMSDTDLKAACLAILAELEREFFASMRPSSLLKRFATPEEVANMVVFLASPLASATNGAAVRAEGGLLRSIL